MMHMQCPRATATSNNGLMALGTLTVMLARQVPLSCTVQYKYRNHVHDCII